MTELIFKIKKSKKNGRSPIEIILGKDKLTVGNTDEILSTLDKLLKRNKIKLEDINSDNIKARVDKEAGLTSTRIVKAVIKALCFKSTE